jgi:hypothetical protein
MWQRSLLRMFLGSVMAWSDEYWKTQISVKGCNPTWGNPNFNAGNCEWKAHADCPNPDINYNSLCGYWLPATSDGYVNEGWFGINRIQKNLSNPGVDLVSPRSVYFHFRKQFAQVIDPPSECAPLYSQCGGMTWHGSKCCVGLFTKCSFHHKYYSQCEPICASSAPCWSPGVGCGVMDMSRANGRGLGYCGNQTRCTDFSVCYESDPARCDCAYDTPCRNNSDPYTCVAISHSTKSCPSGTNLCSLSSGDQCDGMDYYGPTTCPSGTSCVAVSPWLSRCQ